MKTYRRTVRVSLEGNFEIFSSWSQNSMISSDSLKYLISISDEIIHPLKLRIFWNYSRPSFENLIRKSNDVRFVVEITLYFWQWQVSSLEHFGTEPVFVPKSESLEHYLFVSHILNFLLRCFWKYFLSKLPIFQNFVRLNLETSQTQLSNRRPDNQSKMRFSFSDFQDFFWSHFLRRKKWFSEYWYWLTSDTSLFIWTWVFNFPLLACYFCFWSINLFKIYKYTGKGQFGSSRNIELPIKIFISAIRWSKVYSFIQ